MVVAGIPRQPGDFFVGITLILVLMTRSISVYGPLLAGHRSWLDTLGLTHAALVGGATALLVGILLVHGTDVTAAVSKTVNRRPLASGLLGIGLLVAIVFLPVIVPWLVETILTGVSSLDLTVVSAVTAVGLTIGLAAATAIAIYAAIFLSLATVAGYLLVATAATERFGYLVVAACAGIIAGIVLVVPGGILIELVLTSMVAGAGLIIWGSDFAAFLTADRPKETRTISVLADTTEQAASERSNR